MNVPASDLSGLTTSSYTVTATVSDKAGNPASADHALAVDVTAPDLTINTVAGDDIINAIEHGQALVVSGTSTGAAAGDVVTVTLNGKNYTTTLDASGNWSVGIPAADVTALATGSQTITASLSDRAGNSDSTTHDVTVDLSGPTLTINTVSGDDIINNTENPGSDHQRRLQRSGDRHHGHSDVERHGVQRHHRWFWQLEHYRACFGGRRHWARRFIRLAPAPPTARATAAVLPIQ